MVEPEFMPSAAQPDITANKLSGNGYWAYTPENPVAFADGVELLKGYTHFVELPQIIDEAAATGSVLLQGEPGSGKSHIVRELQEGCVAVGIPCFCLTVHINGAKASGAEVMRGQLEAFKEATADSGGVIILDNIDFIGYKGHARSRGATKAYAQEAASLVEVIQDPKYTVFGTSHNDLWRDAHWAWQDEAIDEPARKVLEGFASRLTFQGRMALIGLVEIMKAHHEEVTVGQTARVIRLLHAAGRDDFFHANHLDPHEYLADPAAALSVLDAGRQERTTRTKS